MCAEIDCSAHRLRFRLVVQPETELSLDLGLVGEYSTWSRDGQLIQVTLAPIRSAANVIGVVVNNKVVATIARQNLVQYDHTVRPGPTHRGPNGDGQRAGLRL
ncbi:hypothetical protein ACLQ3H_16860 [Micromonospora saelicesensis]|uniref:hypothetical protein n=1 Tax=Micromonospora saelicesensis TaxID=285676 RepID=UPI003CF67F9A